MALIDSRGSGYLKPLSTVEADTESALIDFVSQLTGLEKTRIRWAWTPRPGSPISFDEDWCAIGLLKITSAQPYRVGKKGVVEDPESGDTTHVTHQTLTVSFSFYGRHAADLADLFRDGAQLNQNFNALSAKGLTIQAVSAEAVRIPDLVGNQWRDRYMLELKIGRVVSRRFGVRTIASAGFEIHTEKGKINA